MTASDDGGNVALAWELVGGGHSAFDLSTDGALSVAVGVLLDFELQPLHTLHVKVTGGSFGDGPSSLSTSSAVEIGEIRGFSVESDSYIESIGVLVLLHPPRALSRDRPRSPIGPSRVMFVCLRCCPAHICSSQPRSHP